MSLQRRRDRYVIIYMFKILYSLVPNDVGIQFYENPRLGFKARVPPVPAHRSRLSLLDSSFAVRGSSLWNLLPKNINTQESFNDFKQKLDVFLLTLPDMPPVSGYTTANTNALSCWA